LRAEKININKLEQSMPFARVVLPDNDLIEKIDKQLSKAKVVVLIDGAVRKLNSAGQTERIIKPPD
jgi:hypothetical protein